MSRIGIFGAGWVGLVTGTCFAELGHEVVIRDVLPEKVARLRRGEVPFHEDDVPALLERNRHRLSFTLDAHDVADCQFLFVCVDTPPTYSGDADLSRVWTVIDDLPELEGNPTVVMKSTVPVGTGEKIRHGLDARGLAHVGYVSNPEFLAEGSAVRDFLNPDRIVVGAFDRADADAVASLYDALDAPLVRCDVNSAEMIKLAANAFLMTRISFINEIANVCEATGADVVKVAEGIGLDHRLGPHFLRAGIGYGGSCLRGAETVFVRRDGEPLPISLERLFEECAEAGPPGTDVLTPAGLEVLAWDPRAQAAAFERVTTVTRRWYEGELLGVSHGGGRRVRVTPDHPFVTAAEPGGQVTVELAAALGRGSWLPLIPLGTTEQAVSARPVEAPASRAAAGGTTLATAERPDVVQAVPEPGSSPQWRRAEHVSRHAYAGFVYSLEVPGPDTFVTTGGLVVHNCFPKDSLALKQLASNSGYHFQLLSAVIEVNELQKRRVIGKLKKHLGSLRGKRVALLGLAFKPDTDDMREAPSIVLASRLLAEGADVRGWDPVARGEALPHGVEIADSVEEAVYGADAAVVVTEWKELRDLPREEIRQAMANPLIIDGRNLLDPAAVRAAGFAYEGVGRAGGLLEELPETVELAGEPD